MYDVIIIGAGSMGSAASYFLAKEGKNVLCIDAFDPPHTEGSHHGETRIIRYAYGEGADYVELALRAGELWHELEQLTNKQLLIPTGMLNMATKDAPFIENVRTSAAQFYIDVEPLHAQAVNQRYPGITLPHTMEAIFEAHSGILRVEECVASYRQLATELGAVFHINEPVTHIELGETLRITTANTTYEGKSMIVCAGAWSKQLLKTANIDLPLTITRKTFAWFEADERYDAAHFPAFVLERENYCYYGFPSIDGSGFKVGRHDAGEPIDPTSPLAPFNDEDLAELQYFIDTYMPFVGSLKFGKECKYNMTPDEDFIIDTLPQHKNVIIGTGFSGHGFKFSSAVGELLANMAMNQQIPYHLQRFALSRFN